MVNARASLACRSRASLREFADAVLGETPPRTGRRDLVVLSVLFLIGVALCIVRLPLSGLRVLWAEDGSVFVTDALAHPWWELLLQPYAGYMHLVPRVLSSSIVAAVGLAQVPLATTVAAACVTSATGMVAVWALRSRIPSWGARIALWAVVVLLPAAAIEVNGSIANSHWYLLFACAIVLSTRQASRGGVAIACLVVASAVLSDPQAVVFAPMAILRLIARPSAGRWAVPGTFFAALVVQLLVVLGSTSEGNDVSPGAGALARSVVVRVFLQLISGTAGAQLVWDALGIAGALLAVVCVTGLLVVGARTGGLGWSLVVTATATALYLASAYLRWFPELDPRFGDLSGGSRYAVVPILLMSAVVAMVASRAPRLPRPQAALLLTGTTGILVAVTISSALTWGVSARASDLNWAAEVRDARQVCADHPHSSTTITGVPSGFDVEVPCRIWSEQP